MSEELAKEFPANTLLHNYWLPTIRGYTEIRQGKPAQALKDLEPAAPYDLAFPQPQFEEGGLLYPAYVRGQAYLLLHRGKEAADEFQKLLDHRGVILNSPLAALARYQLARALAMSGDASGKTPTPTFPSLRKPRWSTRSCGELFGTVLLAGRAHSKTNVFDKAGK